MIGMQGIGGFSTQPEKGLFENDWKCWWGSHGLRTLREKVFFLLAQASTIAENGNHRACWAPRCAGVMFDHHNYPPYINVNPGFYGPPTNQLGIC